MKKIRVPVGTPAIVTKFPPPPPPPPPLQAAFTESTGEPDERLHGLGMRPDPSPPLAPLPPAPPQMNRPVGPPPVEEKIPTDFEGLLELATKVGLGAMTNKAQVWATLAQAVAVNRQSDLIEELLEFIGARDGEHHDAEPPRLGDQIADGLVMAGDHVLRSLVPDEKLRETLLKTAQQNVVSRLNDI